MVFGLMFSFGVLANAQTFTFTRNLSFGARGEDVRMLQQILKDKSFLSGTADGKFGNLTKNAVKLYQTSKSLVSDGKVGPKTRAKLNEENTTPSCPQYAPPAPGWCSNGTVVGPTIDPATGCYSNVTCVPSVLQTIYSQNNNVEISECTYNGQNYYEVALNAYDGGSSVVDLNGTHVGGCQGFSGVCTGILPQSCQAVYTVFPNIWHHPAINTYNLH